MGFTPTHTHPTLGLVDTLVFPSDAPDYTPARTSDGRVFIVRRDSLTDAGPVTWSTTVGKREHTDEVTREGRILATLDSKPRTDGAVRIVWLADVDMSSHGLVSKWAVSIPGHPATTVYGTESDVVALVRLSEWVDASTTIAFCHIA